MGCCSNRCALTGIQFREGEEVVMIPIARTERMRSEQWIHDPTDYWQLAGFPLIGKYDDYGFLEDINSPFAEKWNKATFNTEDLNFHRKSIKVAHSVISIIDDSEEVKPVNWTVFTSKLDLSYCQINKSAWDYAIAWNKYPWDKIEAFFKIVSESCTDINEMKYEIRMGGSIYVDRKKSLSKDERDGQDMHYMLMRDKLFIHPVSQKFRKLLADWFVDYHTTKVYTVPEWAKAIIDIIAVDQFMGYMGKHFRPQFNLGNQSPDSVSLKHEIEFAKFTLKELKARKTEMDQDY